MLNMDYSAMSSIYSLYGGGALAKSLFGSASSLGNVSEKQTDPSSSIRSILGGGGLGAIWGTGSLFGSSSFEGRISNSLDYLKSIKQGAKDLKYSLAGITAGKLSAAKTPVS